MSLHFPTLHIYQQYQWHDSPRIIGNLQGLRALRDAIDACITEREFSTLVFCEDGESYAIEVVWATEEELEKTRLPYSILDTEIYKK